LAYFAFDIHRNAPIIHYYYYSVKKIVKR